MKQQILFFSTLLAFLTSCNRPEPNYEGVLMTNYGREGLADFKVVTGAQGPLWPGNELYQVPMFEQKAECDLLVVTASDGGAYSVDPAYTYEAVRGKGPEIVYNYKHVGANNEFLDNIETNVLNQLVLNAYQEEARKFKTDELLNNVAKYELQVETRLKTEFNSKFFNLLSLRSGLRPPTSMTNAIESRNNIIQETERERNEIELAKMRQQKELINTETNKIISSGLTKEILLNNWIEALRNTDNKVIITDGKVPVILN
jgi:hypothetical protein